MPFGDKKQAGKSSADVRPGRRFKLFIAAFLLAAAASAAALFFLPGLKGGLHASSGGGGREPLSIGRDDLFKDVSPEDEFAAEIAHMKKRGMIRGFEDGSFRPREAVKREEFIKLVVAAKKADPHPVSNGHCFSDVGGEWFARFVCYAKRTGLVVGHGDGSFGTGDNITVREAETIIDRAFGGLKGAAEEAAGSFNDDLTRGAAAGLIVRALNASNSAL